MQWYASVQPVVISYSIRRFELNFSQTSFVKKKIATVNASNNEQNVFSITFRKYV